MEAVSAVEEAALAVWDQIDPTINSMKAIMEEEEDLEVAEEVGAAVVAAVEDLTLAWETAGLMTVTAPTTARPREIQVLMPTVAAATLSTRPARTTIMGAALKVRVSSNSLLAANCKCRIFLDAENMENAKSEWLHAKDGE